MLLPLLPVGVAIWVYANAPIPIIKIAAQDDATKQKLAEEARQNLAKKDQEIAKSVQDKAMEAAKAVGDAKGLSVVMTKDTVLYGGVDITDQVLKKLANDAKK